MPASPKHSREAAVHQPGAPLIPGHIALRRLREYSGVNFARATFYRWLQSGLIPARKFVNRWYLADADLRKFAADAEFL